MTQQQIQQRREIAKKLIKTYFKNDYGEPFLATDGQADIFNTIVLKEYPRNQIITPTQYGKSDTISMGLLVRSELYKEPWAIVSGQQDKAMIIMSRVIQHAFDHPRFYKKLELDDNVSLDRLRRERSKDHITWAGGGSIRTFTANIRNRNAVKEALTGFGSQNIVEDEASLIPDDAHMMVLRMLGGHADSFLLKIGNPFYRNHFFKTWHSTGYNKVFIDHNQALSEGRYTPEFIDEVKNMPFFDVLYECKFPEATELFGNGYRQLISEEMLANAFITEEQFKELCTVKLSSGEMVPEGDPRLGVDFAGGGRDKTAYTMRWGKVAKKISTNRFSDTMQQIPVIEDLIEQYEIPEQNVAIDYGGLGQGIGDRLHERDVFVNSIMFGQSSPEKDKHKNMRAYMFYELFSWIKQGGKIVIDDDFQELTAINYKEDSERKFQIQTKEDLKKIMRQKNITASSPDVADSLALTFADNSELITDDDFDFI